MPSRNGSRIPGGFVLPSGPRDSRTFPTATGKAHFTVNPPDTVEVPPGHLLLQTVRSHDQFNTTVYGLDDRYRGIKGGRRVVFVNADDLASLGLGRRRRRRPRQRVDRRRAAGRRRSARSAYPTPPGCAAAYFPEANVLVPLDSTAETSNTPDVEVDRDPAGTRRVAIRRRSPGRPRPARARIASTGARLSGHQLDLSRRLVQQHQTHR